MSQKQTDIDIKIENLFMILIKTKKAIIFFFWNVNYSLFFVSLKINLKVTQSIRKSIFFDYFFIK